MSDSLQIITLLAALGCGLNAGVFFTFSSFVMAGLKDLSPDQGIAAMQSINRKAVTFAFMAALFGTALLCLGLAVYAATSLDDDWAPLVLAGGAIYLVGAILVTMVRNVPMNNRVEALKPDDPVAADYWREYLSNWTAWNHLRTITCLAAATLMTIALLA
jgi:uncharacterized membrane protein